MAALAAVAVALSMALATVGAAWWVRRPASRDIRIRIAAAVHGVGKVETPREVLNKADHFSDEEFAVIRRHPVDGAGMVAPLGDDELTVIVRHHHERLDGRGYPDGLSGDRIPLGGRVLAGPTRSTR